MILKYKYWHDMVINFSWLILDEGDSGVIFRFTDQANYYYIQISMKGLKLMRVLRGVTHLIENADTPLIISQWYRFQVSIQNQIILLSGSIEGQPDQKLAKKDWDDLPFMLRGEDRNIVRGRVGFFSNGTRTTNFDHFSTYPLKCSFEEPLEEVSYIPLECNRYRENFKSNLLQSWKQVDPVSYIGTPGNWKFLKTQPIDGIFPSLY